MTQSAVTERPLLRGASHLVAFVAALTIAPILIVTAPGIVPRLVTSIYALAVVGLFGISALYHRGPWDEHGRAMMRRLDHSMIFVVIAATYTPIAAFGMPGSTARWMLPIIWIGAAIGVAGRLLWSSAPSAVVAAPYVLLGWMGLIAADEMLAGLGPAGFVLVLAGGGLFTIPTAVEPHFAD
jgi:hemolysin III